MKGQSKEIVELAIVIVIIVIVGLISFFFLTGRSINKQQITTEEREFQQISEASKNIFYTKLPGIDKTLSQILSDRMMQEDDYIFYGEGYGVIDANELITNYMNQYYQDNWNLTVLVILKNINPMWFPNAQSSTISKVSSEDGFEIGRYRTVPESLEKSGNPSRIGIDSKGNAWIGNRGYPTIVKIGLKENEQCIDKNNNGIIETSYDKNNNGIIESDEMLGFDQDECILLNVRLADYTDKVFVRAVCVDENDNVYAGLYDDKKLFYINGVNGKIIFEKNLPETPYGCFVDKNGRVWLSTLKDTIMVFNPKTRDTSIFSYDNCRTYGITPCKKSDCMFVNCNNKKIIKINTEESVLGRKIWEIDVNLEGGKGIITDEQDNIYAVYFKSNKIAKFDQNGNIIKTSDTCNGAHGVGLDSKGKIWVACSDSYIKAFDENLNFITATSFGDNHYVYNFFSDYNVKINEIKNTASYGNNFKDVDPSRIKTFHLPIPLPGSSKYAEAILYVW